MTRTSFLTCHHCGKPPTEHAEDCRILEDRRKGREARKRRQAARQFEDDRRAQAKWLCPRCGVNNKQFLDDDCCGWCQDEIEEEQGDNA